MLVCDLCLLNPAVLVVSGLSDVLGAIGRILLSYLVHMHKSEVFETRTGACGPDNLGGSATVNSRSLAWAKEAKARACVEELSIAVDNLQVYCNTLHEEVHVLYSQLHPNVPADPVGMGAGPSGAADEALGGNWTFLGPLLQ
jgi:hypothetical protein